MDWEVNLTAASHPSPANPSFSHPSILFLNRVHPPDEGATGQLLAEVALVLAETGQSVTILCAGSASFKGSTSNPKSKIHPTSIALATEENSKSLHPPSLSSSSNSNVKRQTPNSLPLSSPILHPPSSPPPSVIRIPGLAFTRKSHLRRALSYISLYPLFLWRALRLPK